MVQPDGEVIQNGVWINDKYVDGSIAVECSPREIIHVDGKCKTCEDHTYPSFTGRDCISDSETCSVREYTNVLGKCDACPDYFIGAGNECILFVCGPRERVTKEASCEACDDYTKASSDGKTCESDTCLI